jgi:hypothetical protein
MRRISIVSMMSIVSFIAFALGAFRNANEFWAGATLVLTITALGTAVIATMTTRGGRRYRWAGFALFGIGYFVLTFTPYFPEIKSKLLTTQLLGFAEDQVLISRQSSLPLHRLVLQRDFDQKRLLEANPSDPSYDRKLDQYKKISDLVRAKSPGRTDAAIPTTPPIVSSLRRLLPGIDNSDAFACVWHSIFALVAGVIGAAIASRFHLERNLLNDD